VVFIGSNAKLPFASEDVMAERALA